MRKKAFSTVALALSVGACTAPKDVSELKPVLDPLAVAYGDCLDNVAGHYARSIQNPARIRVVAIDICEKKRRAIESTLFDEEAKPDQVREYMRGVQMGANSAIAAGIRRGRAEAGKAE